MRRLARDGGGGVGPLLDAQIVQLRVGAAAKTSGEVIRQAEQIVNGVVVLAGREHAGVKRRRLRFRAKRLGLIRRMVRIALGQRSTGQTTRADLARATKRAEQQQRA